MYLMMGGAATQATIACSTNRINRDSMSLTPQVASRDDASAAHRRWRGGRAYQAAALRASLGS
jgi:hypothetical protein